MSIPTAQKPAGTIAHERAIIEDWVEDDDVYVKLGGSAAGRAMSSARAAAPEPEGSQAPAASLPPPTPR